MARAINRTSLIGLVSGGVVLLGQLLVVRAVRLRLHLIGHVVVTVTDVIQHVTALCRETE